MSNVVYQMPAEVAVKFPDVANTTYQIVAETARNADQYLHVTGAIGNHRVDTHVIQSRRYANLCSPGQRATLLLDSSFPGPVVPGLLTTLYERGTKVLTGYVVRASKSRPSHEWSVEIEDAYTRVSSYFIDTPMDFPNGSSAYYLIGQILEPTGITYRIVGDDVAVPPGTSIGLRTAHDALNDVLVYGSWYAWVDADGVLQIKKHTKRVPIVVRDPIHVERAYSTEQTRNVVKVYGQATETGMITSSLAQSLPESPIDLVTVVANPLIKTVDDAERVGNYLLHELATPTNIITFDVEGDPTLQIGTSGSLHYVDPATGESTSGSGPITSVESKVDQNGYIMTVTIGERCPRISGWTADPRELRAIWIAARGGGGDPRPEKLIWTGDFGAGGQPTYNILSDIPSGTIAGMHVTRNGRRVYLFTKTTSAYGDQVAHLYYSDNPYDRTPDWMEIAKSGDDVEAGAWRVDFGYFNGFAFNSAQMVGNTLYLTVRALGNPGQRTFFYGEIGPTATSITYTHVNVTGTSICGTKNLVAYEFGSDIRFRPPGQGFPVTWAIHNELTFGLGLRNGIDIVAGQRQIGGWWINDYGSPVLYADETRNQIRDRAWISFTTTNGKYDPARISIRGDYWGSQFQFVDTVGHLYVGYPGTISFRYRWGEADNNNTGAGIVVCTDKSFPNRLAWFPRSNAIANEVARYSKDGGATWENMTGNWWGTNSEVVSKSKMQSVGGFALIDAHPTFWSSEAPTA